METRSKSQSGRKDSIMADENHSTGKPTCIDFSLKNKDKTNNEIQGENRDNEASLKGSSGVIIENSENTTTLKGIVATRIEQINNSPVNSPLPARKDKKLTRSNKKAKLKMLGAKNGKLSIEEENESSSSSDHADEYQHVKDATDYTEEIEQGSLMSILRELNTTVKHLESKIDNMEKDRKHNEKKVRQISIVQSQDTAAINNLTSVSEDQGDKIKVLTGIVLRQQQQIDDLTYKLNNLYSNNNSKKLIINGLAETQGENCFHEVANFFKNIMKIETAIPLKFARRVVGTGAERSMMIKLKNFEHKSIIFQKFDRLKQMNRSRQHPYFISEQLPEAWAERRRFVQQLKSQNSKLPAAVKHDISVVKGEAKIDGNKYQPLLETPTIKELLNVSMAEKSALQNLEVLEGVPEIKENNLFIGYAAEVFSVEQVRHFHLRLKFDHPDAAHISVAFKIPGADFTNNQGFIDDGEHGGARAIMKVLLKEKEDNTALFVVRYYGGRHIGSVRFQAIEKAAKSALEKKKEAALQARRLPTEQELVQINAAIQNAAKQDQQQEDPIRYNWGDGDTQSSEDQDDADTSQASLREESG